jgi:predicted transcriptional regulator
MRRSQKRKILIVILFIIGIQFSFIGTLLYLRKDMLKSREGNFRIDQTDYNSNLIFIDSSIKVVYDDSKYAFKHYYELLLDKDKIIFIASFSIGTFICITFSTLFNNRSTDQKIREYTQLEIEGVPITEEEMKVFILIQDFLSHNRVFSQERAAVYIKSRYDKVNDNLNHNGIKKVIISLKTKKIIVEGSKLTRKTVLQNSNRKQIFDFIKENPGIYKNKIASKLHFSHYLIKWHLSILMKFNFIREYWLNDHVAYFDALLNPKNDNIFLIISKEKCHKIIEFLKTNKNGNTRNQISKELHVHYKTITKYLENLEKFNLLIRKQQSNKEYLFLNENKLKKLLSTK